MLTELQISNFAIIENQSMQFGKGLNVITGETGSGKSIILNALELILGGRSNSNFIRSKCDSLEVQAHFDLSALPIKVLETLPDIARNEELAVVRTLTRTGKGKVYINGNLGTVSLLHDIGNKLISVCSQSQQIKLLEQAYHLELLDGFIGEPKTLSAYAELYNSWKEKKKELEHLEARFSEREARIIFLEETIAELKPLDLTPTLRSELEIAVKRLSSLQKIQLLASETDELLNNEDGTIAKLTQAVSSLSDIERIDPSISTVQELLLSAKNELHEADRELQKYISGLELDDEAHASLSERLTTLARLERKHRTDTAGLCRLLVSSIDELKLLSKGEGLGKLKEEILLLEKALQESAQKLSTKRKVKAKELQALIEGELSELHMRDVRFQVAFSELDYSSCGTDKVEFLISSNAGEAPRALRHIASGGELSRITLVLKKILRDTSGVNVLVFDEVDSGISGAVARLVGQKLQALSQSSQVICITHLPQVASLADLHLLVSKSTSDRTVTFIRQLTEKERIDEVARMLSGFEITKSARDTARSLMRAQR